jgi:predicted O-linked N-acetylglucosamine transferase (SPINDLY family)
MNNSDTQITSLFIKANTLRNEKKLTESLNTYEQIISIEPHNATAWFNKGNVLQDMGQLEQAISSFDTVLTLTPNDIDALTYRGHLFYLRNHYIQAIENYNQAIQLDPNNQALHTYCAQAHVNQAVHYTHAQNYLGAIEHYQQALILNPTQETILGNLLHCKMCVCDWDDFDSTLKQIENAAQENQLITPLFVLFIYSLNIQLQKSYTQFYTHQKYPFNPELGPISAYQHTKIKVAYFSADFYDHATTRLMAELFESHNHNDFEWFAFSFGPAINDDMLKRIQPCFDHFINVTHLSDKEVAQYTRQLEIDIAIDLKGFTSQSRPGIFAYRTAPIQVNYLGYPSTMGAPYIDYLIADKTVIPKNYQTYYSEKIIYLPHCYQPNDSQRDQPTYTLSRRDFNLPENDFIFCCFNNNYKITPHVFSIWMRLLKRIPNSSLWLLESNPIGSQNLKKYAAQHHIDESRLIFAKKCTPLDHLARHSLADLFLDTWPYNAHTTASDALWMGLPLITCMKETFASRVAGSLLHTLNLNELITTNEKDYEDLAYRLASDTKYVNKIKTKLNTARKKSSLFQGKKFAKDIEQLYKTITLSTPPKPVWICNPD